MVIGFVFLITDINECSVSNSICDVNAKCQNSEGSYLCFCKVGFVGDGKTCTGKCSHVIKQYCTIDLIYFVD